jgi:hypothetical protein
MAARLSIACDYQGAALAPEHRAEVELSWHGAELRVVLDAPYYADPPPPSAAGSTDRLWEYEVAELFIAGPDQRYLELEFGPHGHQLVLLLDGVRRVRDKGLALDYHAQIEHAAGPQRSSSGASGAEPVGRYRGVAHVPAHYLPANPTGVNAYLIHGVGAQRCYCAHAPVPGSQPDFHRLDCFAAWPAAL